MAHVVAESLLNSGFGIRAQIGRFSRRYPPLRSDEEPRSRGGGRARGVARQLADGGRSTARDEALALVGLMPRTEFGKPLTTWSFEPGFVFGGVNGAPEKRIDAIVSTHGFPQGPGPHPHISLERFYFTDLYGPTRWEAWKLAADNPKTPSGRCHGPTEMVYQGRSKQESAVREFRMLRSAWHSCWRTAATGP